MSEQGQHKPLRLISGLAPDGDAGPAPAAGSSPLAPAGATIERDHVGRITRIKTLCGSAQFRYDGQGRLYAFIYARVAWSTGDGVVWTARDSKNDYEISGTLSVDESGSIFLKRPELRRELKIDGAIQDTFPDGRVVENNRQVPQFTPADLLATVTAIGTTNKISTPLPVPQAGPQATSQPRMPAAGQTGATKTSGSQPAAIPVPGAAPVPQTSKISRAHTKPGLLPLTGSAFSMQELDQPRGEPVRQPQGKDAGASPTEGIMISPMAWKDPSETQGQLPVVPWQEAGSDLGGAGAERLSGQQAISLGNLRRASERGDDVSADGSPTLVTRMEDGWVMLQLSAMEKVLGGDHPSLLPLLDRASIVNRRQCRLDLAESCATRSLDIRTKHDGANHTDLSIPLIELASIAAEMGRWADAEGHYVKVVDVLEKGLSKARFMSWAKLAPTNYQSQCLSRLLHAAAQLLNLYGRQKKTVAGQKLKQRVEKVAQTLDPAMQERFAASLQAIAQAPLPDNSGSMDAAPIRRTIATMKTADSEELSAEETKLGADDTRKRSLSLH